MSQCFRIERIFIEFKKMKEWKVSIESSIVIDIYFSQRIGVNSSVIIQLAMILATNVIQQLLLVMRGNEKGMIK